MQYGLNCVESAIKHQPTLGHHWTKKQRGRVVTVSLAILLTWWN